MTSLSIEGTSPIRRLSRQAIAGLIAAMMTGTGAGGAHARGERWISVEERAAGEPIMAIVSLRSQRVTIYDAGGMILRASVSSGQRGRETPAGIFSVIEKQAEHYSNLYDDAFMPHMQRITWSGIALHGGVLPGRPASHGCVRMPYDFAERLFGATRLGMRVIVAPRDVAPVEVAHAALLQPKPGAAAAAAALAAQAAEATRKADEARLAAVTASREAARAALPVRTAENLKRRAEERLAAAERALAAARSDEERKLAEDARAAALAKVTELDLQLAVARDELQRKLEAVPPAREAAVAAEAARAAAVDAARRVARDAPVSVFISRKTQRLYVRQGFTPVLESPVTIKDADRPIGTHVFTAMERSGDDTLRWSAVSLDPGHGYDAVESRGPKRVRPARDAEPPASDPSAAKAALDRIDIAPEVRERIAALASPRSSLIVSDEPLSSETGKGTEFVVLMSGEPQGALKMRRRHPYHEVRYLRPRHRQPAWPAPFGLPFVAR